MCSTNEEKYNEKVFKQFLQDVDSLRDEEAKQWLRSVYDYIRNTGSCVYVIYSQATRKLFERYESIFHVRGKGWMSNIVETVCETKDYKALLFAADIVADLSGVPLDFVRKHRNDGLPACQSKYMTKDDNYSFSIKLPTVYKGWGYNSFEERLWAELFDKLGADWEYHPQAIQLRCGDCYQPTFAVKQHDDTLYVQVVDEQIDEQQLQVIKVFMEAHPLLLVGSAPVRKINTMDSLVKALDTIADEYNKKIPRLYRYGKTADEVQTVAPSISTSGQFMLADVHNFADVDEAKTITAYKDMKRSIGF